MTKKIFLVVILMTFVGITSALAKDIRTAIFKVNQMECQNCEKKVRNNIKFEKGLKKIETNLENKTVTITYDADKTTVENIQAGFKKFNYEAKFVEESKEGENKK
ncbi:heavy-metal-associated domain-containing protein [Bacteroides sp. 519]|uniref:heavy-metal-associated domain-containing protein n=1 Tax=Bacteroides sp. 519 TaxID=2302937 RepID=UPI0013CFADB7|nr:heavy-metal-associated domain-containing protein [Bacteroides sp. 519]NDV58566.1 cation transporter [Bacteroides sp. 519]